jgi:putative component of toxin-antitoxin plasmid stabilization module
MVKARILSRLDSARLGNLGDARSLGGGLHEMRVHAGAGYRKPTQDRDIVRARRLMEELNQE